MLEKLTTRQTRIYFFVIIGLLLLAIFLIRHLLIPYLTNKPIRINSDTLSDILDKLFVSTLVTVGLAAFIFFLTPQNKLNAQIKVLQPIEIGQTLIKARTDTEKWWFNGGSGRYTRSVTLPYLAELARAKNKTIDVTIQIMNPKNRELCEKYANYRNGLRTGKKTNPRTFSTVQIDLISTIVATYIWRQKQSLLNITLGLKENFSLFRTDLSSSGAIITKEDPIEPAILYESGTFFYHAQLEDLKQSLSQVKTLDMNIRLSENGTIDQKFVRALLIKLEMFDLITEADIPAILKKAQSTHNPYA